MKAILLNISFALFILSAHSAEVSGLKVIEGNARHIGNLVELNILLECNGIAISTNEQLEVRPVLVKERDTLRLAPLLFTGNTRAKVNHRLARFSGDAPTGYANINIKQLAESGHTKITYTQQIPFQEWMFGSRVILENRVTGCAECQRELASIPVAYIPRKLAVSYVVPRPEQKIRHKNVSLYLNFHQAKSDILPDYMDNRMELAKADSLISELTSDPYVTVDSITVIGYASPEGKYDYNTKLSGSRAQALKKYLESKSTPDKYMVTTVAASEDWDGLRKEIIDANLANRTQLLYIIDSIPNPDTRDSYIRKLDNGITYNDLLQNYYPPLRRVVCDARYVVKPFTTEQAKQRLSTHPEQLSLNEMYLIAQSYPAASPLFNELFVEMLSFYPDNVVAKNNLAAVALEAGDTQRAKSCLEAVSQSPVVQNNLGILFYREGKIGEAKHCFEKAAANGCKEARYNLQEINTLMAIQ